MPTNLVQKIQQVSDKVDTLYDLVTTVNDADTVINKLKDLEAFLAGISDTSTLTSLLVGYVSKASDIINNTTSTATNQALAAAIGKTLADSITALTNTFITKIITDSTTLVLTDRFVHAIITASSKSITLISAPVNGQRISISLDSSSTYDIDINGNGKSINGSASAYALSLITVDSINYLSSIELMYYSTTNNWIIL